MSSDQRTISLNGSKLDEKSPNKRVLNSFFTKDHNSKHSDSEKEIESEAETSSLRALVLETKKRKGMGLKDGKTVHPKVNTLSRETRELAKKQLRLEKNLKIDGMPDPPKMRKRRYSVGSNLVRDKEIAFKRKRLNTFDARPKKDHMPKWELIGGDATDPLNLNGLANSEEGRLLNENTPKNSPLPTPDFRKIVFLKIPPNIEDPLNLDGKHDQKALDKLLSATRKKRHRSKKNKDVAVAQDIQNKAKETVESKLVTQEDNKAMDCEKPEKVAEEAKSNLPDDTLQAGPLTLNLSPEVKLKRQSSGGSKANKPVISTPMKFPAKPKFTLGNYNRYYGYRNQDHQTDPRLRYFNPLWFENKDILDIGCNVGHLTLAIAEKLSPKKILGMDIDGKLIGAARQNIRHMLSSRRKDSSKFPSSFETTRGPLEAHPIMGSSNLFPNNVLFLQGNYVPGSEEILQMQKEEYDTILALSITKWIHLNNGDHGLKLFFRKIHKQLRPGGRLILEPQPWTTYKKRAKLTPEMYKHYTSIKLRPEGFKNFLLSIGFVKCEVIGVPVAKAKGFRRPLMLFIKADPNSTSLGQLPAPSFNQFRFCTECSNNQTSCDHIQFVGMRQGAYADRLYDHIPYHSAGQHSSESIGKYMSYPSPASHSLNYSFNFPGPLAYPPSGHSFCKSSERSQNSNWTAGSATERSWTSESTHSSLSESGSSYSHTSRSSEASLNGMVNGIDDHLPDMDAEVAADIHWVQNENANLELIDNDPMADGENGDNGNLNGLVNGYVGNDEG